SAPMIQTTVPLGVTLLTTLNPSSLYSAALVSSLAGIAVPFNFLSDDNTKATTAVLFFGLLAPFLSIMPVRLAISCESTSETVVCIGAGTDGDTSIRAFFSCTGCAVDGRTNASTGMITQLSFAGRPRMSVWN